MSDEKEKRPPRRPLYRSDGKLSTVNLIINHLNGYDKTFPKNMGNTINVVRKDKDE